MDGGRTRVFVPDAAAARAAGPGRERLRTRAGEDTSVPFAFTKALLALLELRPSHFCVAFDPSASRVRARVRARARQP